MSLKLITAIVQSDDAHALTDALRAGAYQSTLISSTGGFLREGNATIYTIVEAQQVERVLEIIRENCTTRSQYINPMPPIMEPGELYMPQPIKVQIGGAVVFVMEVERMERF